MLAELTEIELKSAIVSGEFYLDSISEHCCSRRITDGEIDFLFDFEFAETMIFR